MWPVGAMLLFMGACPSGWAPPPPPAAHCWSESDDNGPMHEVCAGSSGYLHTGPEGSQWCVKQKDAK